MKKLQLRKRIAELENRVTELEKQHGTVTVRVHTLGGEVLTKTIPFKGYERNHTFHFPAITHPSFTIEEITWELLDGLIDKVQYGSWGTAARGYYIDRTYDFTVDAARWVNYG